MKDVLPSFPRIAADALLSRYPLFETSDLSEAERWGERVFCRNSLRRNHRDRPFAAHMYYRAMRHLGVGRLSYGCDVTIEPGALQSFYLVQMPLRGHELIEAAGRSVCSTTETASLLNAEQVTQVRHGDDTEKLILRVERAALEYHCEQHLGHRLRYPIEFDLALPLGSASGQRWMSLMAWLYDNLSGKDTLPPLIAAQTEQMVLATLLCTQPHNYSAELAGEERSIAPAFVRRLEQYIEEHAAEALTIVTLADHAGVSSRAIYAGFRRYRNTSPMQYLKEVRLQRVRAALLAHRPDKTTVTTQAYAWGFGHLGHFTTDYRRRFGESPSATLAR